jgi:hypothetical protein
MSSVRFLLALFIALGVSGQNAQPFDVAIGGTTGLCVLTLPIPVWHVQFPGISHETNSDIEFIAAGGSGRVLGLVNPQGAVVELRPDLTRTTLFAGANRSGEDLVADAAGNLYVSTGQSGDGVVLAVRPDGTVRAEFPVDATAIDLAADQCTLFYTPTSAAGVRRFNVCSGAGLPDFVATGGGFVRLLPDGGVLTSSPDFSRIARYDAAGALVRTYDVMFADVLALGRAGTTFFAVPRCEAVIGEYDLATGNLLRSITADMNEVHSLVAFNGWTAALGALAAAHVAAVPSLSMLMLTVLGALLALIAFRRLV